jgi:16S rRNA processing protein RimM
MEFSSIGYFTKTHGVKGQLILRDEEDFETQGLTAFFLDADGGKAPYFIEELTDAAQGLIVKLEEVDSIEQAKTFIKKTVYIESRFILEKEEEDSYIGFEVIDEQLGSLGLVTGTSDNGQQDLLSLSYKGKEVILPLAEELVLRIDDTAKIIWYRAPEGLVAIYLED